MLQKISILITLLFLCSCSHPVIYEISTRPWLYELSIKYRTPITRLHEIPTKEFDELQNNGVDIVWMMGVWKLGQYGLEFDRKQDYSKYLPNWTKEDVIGSPYAVYEYECNPSLGNNGDLSWLKQEINKRGMKLMLDFVPNHSAVDAPKAKENPDMYIRAPKGQEIDENKYTKDGIAYGAEESHYTWKDVIQWNYWNKDTVNYMYDNIDTIMNWADAIRCDVAFQELNDVFYSTWKEELDSYGYTKPEVEFWEYAIKKAKAVNPNVLFLAESYKDEYNEKLLKLGFDYVYNIDILHKLMESGEAFKEYIKDKTGPFWQYKANFVENHDEDRLVANMGGNHQKAKAAGTIAATIGGLIFINHGQWESRKHKLDVHLRRAQEEPDNEEIKNYYKKLHQVIKDKAFRGNGFYYAGVLDGERKDDFIAYIREEEDSHYLVVVNFSENEGCATIPIYNLRGRRYILVYDALNDVEIMKTYDIVKNYGLKVCLKAWESQIFKYNY